MKVSAIYHTWDREDGTTVHCVETDTGGFVVSSKEVGVAVQNFLHYATSSDISILHGHLLLAFKNKWADETEKSNEQDAIDREIMRTRGTDDGRAAASWMVDGNTPDPFMFLSKILTGMEEGDPEIMNMLPHPRVGGEFADDPTWEQICMEEIERYEDGEDELFAVYTEAFHEGVESKLRLMYHDYSDHSKKV